MSVETGFVIEARETPKVAVQRHAGYDKAEGKEVVYKTMDLPTVL